MSKRRFDLAAGGDDFTFKSDTEPKIDFWMSKYPDDRKRSAVIPLLWLAQKDNKGWLSEPAMREVADRVGMPYIRVYEVATFYTMFRMQPVGEHHVQLCGTTPCMLRGANDLKKVCESRIGKKGAVSADGKLSWEEVECLGACVNAPMAQINDDYFEDLTPETLEQLLDDMAAGKSPAPGPQIDRITSAPFGGLTTLTDEALYDGSRAQPLSVIPGAPQPEEAPETSTPPTAATASEDSKKPASGVAGSKPQEASKSTGASFGGTKSFDQSSAVSDSGSKPSLEDADRPTALDAPQASGKDDLKRISGVGPKIEGILNDLGVFHFSQVAVWTRDNVNWVDGYLSFRGRIDREEWIAQAKSLAADSGDGEA